MPTRDASNLRTLALETSSTSGSLALLDGDRVVVECLLPRQPRVAQTLIPGLRRLLRLAAWQPGHVELIAVVRGPGSFTGLRVGITAAKTLAYATGAPVLGVDTLHVLAWQACHGLPPVEAFLPAEAFVPQPIGANQTGATNHSGATRANQPADAEEAAKFQATRRDAVPPAACLAPEAKLEEPGRAAAAGPRVHAVLDAQRGELFQAVFRGNRADVERLTPTHITSPGQWESELQAGDAVTGSGLRGLEDELPAGIQRVENFLWAPRAAVCGLVAQRLYADGQRDDFWKLAPTYLRQSAAEEKAQRRS